MTHKPGSNEAVAQGCTCAIEDNHYGSGMDGYYWINGDCPLHGSLPFNPVQQHPLFPRESPLLSGVSNGEGLWDPVIDAVENWKTSHGDDYDSTLRL